MNKKGFTLIELLIVVVIIGILAAIAIPRFGETRERAFISAMQSDLRQVMNAQELYYQQNDFSYYTTDLANPGTPDDDFPFFPSIGVSIALAGAGDSDGLGYSAVATHANTEVSCAVFVGSATPVSPSEAADGAGNIVCDDGSTE